MNKKRSNIKSHGFSLVEVMIAMGISSAVILGWTATLSTGLRGQKSIQVNVDRIAITKFLMQKVDCGKSFDNTTCTAGGPKKLLDKKGLTVVSDAGAGTKFGGLTIKSECNAANDGLTIKAATLSSTGQLTSTSPSDFLPNPLTGKTQTWEDAKALLLPETISLCPTFGGGFQSSEYILIEDREPWGTEGGECTMPPPPNSWRTVKLNYEVSDTKNSVVVNADSSFTLQKGVYECVLNPLLRYTNESRARLIYETTTVDLTTGATVITPTVMAYSQSMRISIASPAVAINHKFTVDTPTKFKLEVWCSAKGTPDALGVGTNTMDGATKVHETFAQVECRKYTQ